MTPGVCAVLAAVLIGGLFALNLAGEQLNSPFLGLPGIDKVLHFGLYVVLFWCLRGLAAVPTTDGTRQKRLAALGGVALALMDEGVQNVSVGRTVEFADIIADGSGIALAWDGADGHRLDPAPRTGAWCLRPANRSSSGVAAARVFR